MSKHFLVAPDQKIVNTKLPLFTDNLLGDDSRKDIADALEKEMTKYGGCLLYTSPSPRDRG